MGAGSRAKEFFDRHITGQLTRCSAIAERPRCRVRYSFGQKWKTGTREGRKSVEFGEKRKIRAIRCHSNYHSN